MLGAATLLEYSPDGIVLHDGERIVAANATMLRMSGATRLDQVVGQPVAAIFEHPFLKDVERQLLAGTPEAVVGGFVRERLYGVDGRVLEVDAHAQLFIDGDRPTVFLVLHDVRDQIAEQHRLQSAYDIALASVGRADASRLAGGVAHVLNNRLQIVLGFANLLAEEELSRDQRLDVEQIVRAATEGADVTRQLLQTAGGATFVPEQVALGTLIPRVVSSLEAQGVGRVRPLRVEIEVAPSVKVDPAHVQYMVSYLVDNARRATRERGRITITVGEAVLRAPQLASQGQRMERGRYTTVSVQDTGEGISAYAQVHMFEPFFTTTRIGDGTGLGLSAVQGLLRQNGGYLTFASTPGVGSTFTLWFPADGTAVSAGGAPTPAMGAILVVDRDRVSRSTTVRCLERVGYHVLEAATPIEAGELLAHVDCPALIVVGQSVGRRGAAVLHRLRARCPAVPLLVLSAEGGDGEAEDVFQADTNALTVRMPSPYSDFLLVSRVRALIGESVRCEGEAAVP